MGVILFRGMQCGFLEGDFTITAMPDGSIESKAILSTAYNVLPIWLRIASDNLKQAKRSHKKLLAEWSTDGERQKRLLISELEYSMQVVVSCGIALDALYDQLRPFANLQESQVLSWRKNRTSRAKQIAEVVRRVYNLRKDTLASFKKGIGEIIQYRDWAVHPSLALKNACNRPDISEGVDWKFAAFRCANAEACFQSTINMLTYLKATQCKQEKVNEQLGHVFEALLELKVVKKKDIPETLKCKP